MAEAEIPAVAPQQVGPGSRKAAAVLLGLGADLAANVFRLLDEGEVRKIALGARDLRKGPAAAVPDALRGFVEAMERVGGEAAAGDDMLREIAAKALGDDVVRRAFDGVLPPPQPDEVLGPISEADPEALAMVLAREQPQTTALVLSALDAEKAAATIEKLPAAVRPQIIRRMATIESVAPEVLKEVGQALAQELRAVVAGGMRKVDGKTAALEILRRSPSQEQSEVVAEIEKDDPKLADDLKMRLFTFDDLKGLSDRDLQAILKEVDSSRLTIALKGATQNLRDKFLRNMSQRAAQLLADDLQAMGAVRLQQVEEAQGEIAKLTLDLAGQGRVTIIRAADKMV
ncbi:MAG: flagellar motor switch protein FliG [Deltaproteobacteria bacterium]|nr:flagellar motor switch protein FliG [Deltaproteobacteria bacterium]